MFSDLFNMFKTTVSNVNIGYLIVQILFNFPYFSPECTYRIVHDDVASMIVFRLIYLQLFIVQHVNWRPFLFRFIGAF